MSTPNMTIRDLAERLLAPDVDAHGIAATPTVPDSPERRLCFAVLLDALLFADGRIARSEGPAEHRQRLSEEAREWLFRRDGDDETFSAVSVCAALGIQHGALLASYERDPAAFLVALHAKRTSVGTRRVSA
jgi:hypothetical protein